jgi:hypothetical protein
VDDYEAYLEREEQKERDYVKHCEDEIDRLKRERDEARREVCELHAERGLVFRRVNRQNLPVTDPKDIAAMKKWDCFQEVDSGQ